MQRAARASCSRSGRPAEFSPTKPRARWPHSRRPGQFIVVWRLGAGGPSGNGTRRAIRWPRETGTRPRSVLCCPPAAAIVVVPFVGVGMGADGARMRASPGLRLGRHAEQLYDREGHKGDSTNPTGSASRNDHKECQPRRVPYPGRSHPRPQWWTRVARWAVCRSARLTSPAVDELYAPRHSRQLVAAYGDSIIERQAWPALIHVFAFA